MPNYAKLAGNVANNEKATKKLGGQSGKGFMPGKSGNPSGRPKSKPITDMFKRILENPEDMAAIQANVAKTLKDRGMAGVILINHIADRVEGKVADELTITDLRDLDDDELEARRKKLDAANS